MRFYITVRFYIILHDKLDTPASRQADKASFMKVASIYNDYGHSSFSLYNGVLLTSPTLFLNGGISDVTELSGKNSSYWFIKMKLGCYAERFSASHYLNKHDGGVFYSVNLISL